jgi:hypothetical protein
MLPVTSLALQTEKNLVMHKCNRMGYLTMHRYDERIHKQLFLVNPHAADCILLPKVITHQSEDCVKWRQKGPHVEMCPGTLEFFDGNGTRRMRLLLVQQNGLY